MKTQIDEHKKIQNPLKDPVFAEFHSIDVLPLIYDEKNQRCNILVFDYDLVMSKTTRITKIEAGKGRKHPVYRFYDKDEGYICEVRYGDATANVLQRGLWTHTINGRKYFESIIGGWINYSHNLTLVKLFFHALVCSEDGHTSAFAEVKVDIESQKQRDKIKS